MRSLGIAEREAQLHVHFGFRLAVVLRDLDDLRRVLEKIAVSRPTECLLDGRQVLSQLQDGIEAQLGHGEIHRWALQCLPHDVRLPLPIYKSVYKYSKTRLDVPSPPIDFLQTLG